MTADPDALPRSRLAVAWRRAALRAALLGLLMGAWVAVAGAPGPISAAEVVGLFLVVGLLAAALELSADPARPLLVARALACWAVGAAAFVLLGLRMIGELSRSGARHFAAIPFVEVGPLALSTSLPPRGVAGLALPLGVVAALRLGRGPGRGAAVAAGLLAGLALSPGLDTVAFQLLATPALLAAAAAADHLDRRLFPEDAAALDRA